MRGLDKHDNFCHPKAGKWRGASFLIFLQGVYDMKKIQNYNATKYMNGGYSFVEDGIYKIEVDEETLYVTSLTFMQEVELDEGKDASEISQYPLEDLLDKFYCHISDFYENLNLAQSQNCYLEFASPDLEDIKQLRSIIGKHVYNKEIDGYVKLIIE